MGKVKYGLKSVYYAVATIAADGTATYDTPVAFPGAVSISMDAQGDITNFYADDIVYWAGANNNGYQGDLEMARYIDAFKKQVLGYIEDQKGLLLEDMNPAEVMQDQLRAHAQYVHDNPVYPGTAPKWSLFPIPLTVIPG